MEAATAIQPGNTRPSSALNTVRPAQGDRETMIKVTIIKLALWKTGADVLQKYCLVITWLLIRTFLLQIIKKELMTKLKGGFIDLWLN